MRAACKHTQPQSITSTYTVSMTTPSPSNNAIEQPTTFLALLPVDEQSRHETSQSHRRASDTVGELQREKDEWILRAKTNEKSVRIQQKYIERIELQHATSIGAERNLSSEYATRLLAARCENDELQSELARTHERLLSTTAEKEGLSEGAVQAAQRLRDERQLKQQSRKERDEASSKLQQLEEQNAALTCKISSLNKTMRLLETQHEKTNKVLEEHDSLYKARREAALLEEVHRKADGDAHMRDLKGGPDGNSVFPVALWIDKGDFNMVYNDGFWRKARDNAQKALEYWYYKMRPASEPRQRYVDEAFDEHEVESVGEPPSDEDSPLWSQDPESVAPTRNKARRGRQ